MYCLFYHVSTDILRLTSDKKIFFKIDHIYIQLVDPGTKYKLQLCQGEIVFCAFYIHVILQMTQVLFHLKHVDL